MSALFKSIAMALIMLPLAAGPSLGADAAKGKKVFNKCKSCHVVNKKKNRIGPHLVGLFGRKAGSVPKYKYSKAMRKSDLVWNAETLDKYLEKPRKFLKGTKMSFAGLNKKAQRDNVIAYLKEATAE